MRLFDFSASPILRFLSRSKKPASESEVSPEILDGLKSLTRTKDWALYKQLLDIFVSAQVKALLQAQDNDAEVHRLRGYVQGLLHAAQIPEQLVQQDDYVKQRDQRSAAAVVSRDDARRGSLYATGYWGN